MNEYTQGLTAEERIKQLEACVAMLQSDNARMRRGEAWVRHVLMDIFATSITGRADAVVIQQHEYNAEDVLFEVVRLAQYAKQLYAELQDMYEIQRNDTTALNQLRRDWAQLDEIDENAKAAAQCWELFKEGLAARSADEPLDLTWPEYKQRAWLSRDRSLELEALEHENEQLRADLAAARVSARAPYPRFLPHAYPEIGICYDCNCSGWLIGVWLYRDGAQTNTCEKCYHRALEAEKPTCSATDQSQSGTTPSPCGMASYSESSSESP